MRLDHITLKYEDIRKELKGFRYKLNQMNTDITICMIE
jgi:hypothetical protein